MTFKDSTENIHGCLTIYYGACDGNMESHDGLESLFRMGLERLFRMIIW